MARQLPPLKALRAFEAAARLRSFTRAAGELAVTQTAISHQVKQLEDWLGFRLFHRLNNALVLTEKGEAFLPEIQNAFDAITARVAGLRGDRRPEVLTIGARPHFASRWLVPRLPSFHAAHPDADIRVFTSFRFPELLQQEFDVAIGRGGHDDAIGEFLFSGDIFPVCSPAYRDRQQLQRPHELTGCTLLHMLTSLEDWSLWLDAVGVTGVAVERGPKFDTHALALDAAVAGWGVALARSSFVADDLQTGRLVAPFDTRIAVDKGWYLVLAKPAEKPLLEAFRTWILAEAKGSRRTAEPAPVAPVRSRMARAIHR